MHVLFQKLIAANALAHGYLFFGPDYRQLDQLALWLIETLEVNRTSSPDVRERLAMTKVLIDMLHVRPTAGTIGIDRIREIKNFLWQKPVRSSRRTVVIGPADCLTPEAQGALLKIAEEPPPHALILLLVRDPELLLSTVVSRFQKLYVYEVAFHKNVDEGKLGKNISIRTYAADFLRGNDRQRSRVIKDVVQQDADNADNCLSDFVTALMLELDKQPLRHWEALKELSHRWRLINQFNVNKRLQLEAVSVILGKQSS